MSSNFYDNGGLMYGVDLHTLISGEGPIVIPVKWGYAVAVPHYWLSNSKRTGTVTSDARAMLQAPFDLAAIPHVPLPGPPPHIPLELINVGVIIAMSTSKPSLNVSSVHGEGQALAVCFDGDAGLNINCGTTKIGIVFNPNSVRTVPSVTDYLSAIGRFALEMGFEIVPWPAGLKKAFDLPIVGPVMKKVVKELLKCLL